METILSVAQVIVPMFLAIALGVLARKKQLMTQNEIRGLQQFAFQFGLPCVVFSSCLTADIGLESLSSMIIVLIPAVFFTFWSLRARKKKFPYFNLPMLFATRETGMLGIPLFIILFGSAELYRFGVLDLTQAVTGYPIIAMLTSNTGENPSPKEIVKKIVTSPLLICCLSGLALNFTGISRLLDSIGVGSVIASCTSFISQPISALMVFSVGYTFSLEKEFRRDIFRLSSIHFASSVILCILAQLAFFLIPGADAMTRWTMLLYCLIPTSYLAPGMGRTREEQSVASGVCSLLTLVTLAGFCVMAVLLA